MGDRELGEDGLGVGAAKGVARPRGLSQAPADLMDEAIGSSGIGPQSQRTGWAGSPEKGSVYLSASSGVFPEWPPPHSGLGGVRLEAAVRADGLHPPDCNLGGFVGSFLAIESTLTVVFCCRSELFKVGESLPSECI